MEDLPGVDSSRLDRVADACGTQTVALSIIRLGSSAGDGSRSLCPCFRRLLRLFALPDLRKLVENEHRKVAVWNLRRVVEDTLFGWEVDGRFPLGDGG